MRIAPIFINLCKNRYNTQTGKPVKDTPPPTELKADTVSFSARIHERFPKDFLRELLHCGLPCPVCGKEMIPLDLLNEPAVDALKLFDANVKNMTEINKRIFYKMADLAPIHPLMNMQDILQMLRAKAEKKLIIEQNDVLNSIHLLKAEVPKNKIIALDKLIQTTRDILLQRSHPAQKFKRKSAVSLFDDFALTLDDEKLRLKVMNLIRKMPTSENNQHAFIVKYSRRSPEEIGMKLYNKDFGTLEHITPDSQGGRVVIWECSEDNGLRGNRSVNEQIAENPQMPEHLQNHFDRLIDIYFDNDTPLLIATQKNLLKEYIFTARNEYEIASREKLNIDISRLGEIPPYMINREIHRIHQAGYTNYLSKLYKMLQDK